MSKWYKADTRDISIDRKSEEFDIEVCSDADGSINLSIPFAIIQELARIIDVTE